MHPGGLKEAARVVVRAERNPVFIQDLNFANRAGKRGHVLVEQGHAGAKGGLCPGGFPAVGVEAGAAPVVELPAPQTAEIQIRRTIGVHEGAGVYAVAALDRLGQGAKGAGGFVADGDSDAEHAAFVASGKVEIVTVVFAGGVRRPHLLDRPGHVREREGHAVVNNRAPDLVHRENMVVHHVVLIAQVVVYDAGFAIMRGVDEQFTVKYMGGGIRRVKMGDEGDIGESHELSCSNPGRTILSKAPKV